jgi:hypothetical protein
LRSTTSLSTEREILNVALTTHINATHQTYSVAANTIDGCSAASGSGEVVAATITAARWYSPRSSPAYRLPHRPRRPRPAAAQGPTPVSGHATLRAPLQHCIYSHPRTHTHTTPKKQKNHLIVRRRVQQRASKQIQQTGPKSGQTEQSTEQSASESECGCAELSPSTHRGCRPPPCRWRRPDTSVAKASLFRRWSATTKPSAVRPSAVPCSSVRLL